MLTPITHRAVAKLSTNMQATLSDWKEKGYQVRSASARYIVAWKPKDAPKDEPETAVLLIDLTLTTYVLYHYLLTKCQTLCERDTL